MEPQQAFSARVNDQIMMSIIWSILFAAIPLGNGIQTGSITVVAKTEKQGQGNVHVALFKDASSFPKNTKSYRGVKLPAETDSVQHTFENVPFGTYAVAVFQDLNGNGELDRNFFGIPSEPYAFSNNPAVKWQEPLFREAAFVLSQAEMRVSIQLKSWKNY